MIYKGRRERTPFKPSKLTVNASSCVLGSKCAILILCFGGTSITFVRESSFFKECFPVKRQKGIRNHANIAKMGRDSNAPGIPLIRCL
jgi:hypothetical protein